MYCKICDKDFSDTEVTRWENEIYCPDCGHSIKLTDSRNKKIIDMDSKLINLARSNYENKPTSELLAIWENKHQDENLMEAVEVIKLILTERGVSLPTQQEKKENLYKVTLSIFRTPGLTPYYQQEFQRIYESNGQYRGKWNWAAFFFTWLWAFTKGAWVAALIILFIGLPLVFISNVFGIIICIIMGIWGNKIYYNAFKKNFVEKNDAKN